jgi:hypothetical protein
MLFLFRLAAFTTLTLLLLLGMGLTPAVHATAITNFSCITSNSPECATVAQNIQISSGVFGDQAIFKISNISPVPSSVSSIYWDDRSNLLSSILGIAAGPGVSYQSLFGKPASLPAGAELDPFFETTYAVSRSGNMQTGINPGEYLKVAFQVAPATTTAVLANAILSGDLRVGLHTISIGREGASDSMVTAMSTLNPPQPPQGGSEIPEPATLLLIGGGLIAIATWSRRKQSRRAG